MNPILSKKRPEKRLLKFFRSQAGRNNTGRITVRHRGAGAKRLYRIIEFGQKRLDVPAKILALEYDPNRTAYLALIEYPDKEKKYVLAHRGAKAGDEILFAEKTELKPGNRLMLRISPLARPFSMLNWSPAGAEKWSGPPEPPPMFWPRKGEKSIWFCLQRKREKFLRIALPPSASFPT